MWRCLLARCLPVTSGWVPTLLAGRCDSGRVCRGASAVGRRFRLEVETPRHCINYLRVAAGTRHSRRSSSMRDRPPPACSSRPGSLVWWLANKAGFRKVVPASGGGVRLCLPKDAESPAGSKRRPKSSGRRRAPGAAMIARDAAGFVDSATPVSLRRPPDGYTPVSQLLDAARRWAISCRDGE